MGIYFLVWIWKNEWE